MSSHSSDVDVTFLMGKKIAQLTKVIYHVNSKNEEHQFELEKLSQGFRTELAQRERTKQEQIAAHEAEKQKMNTCFRVDIERLQLHLNTLNVEKSKKIKEITSVKDFLENEKERNAKLELENSALIEKNRGMGAEIEQLQKELVDLQLQNSKIGILQENMTTVKKDNEKMKVEVKLLGESMAKTEAEKSELSGTISKSKQRIRDAEIRIAESESMMKEIRESTKVSAEREAQRFIIMITERDTQLKDAEKVIEELREEKMKIENETAGIIEGLKQVSGKSSTLLQESQKKETKLVKNLQSMSAKLETANKMWEDSKIELMSKDLKIAEIDKEHNLVLNQVEANYSRILRERNHEIHEISTELKNYREKLEDTELKLLNCEELCEKTSKELSEAKDSLSRTKEIIQGKERDLSQTSRDIRSKTARIGKLERQLANRNRECKALDASREELLAELSEEKSQAECMIDSLREELSLTSGQKEEFKGLLSKLEKEHRRSQKIHEEVLEQKDKEQQDRLAAIEKERQKEVEQSRTCFASLESQHSIETNNWEKTRKKLEKKLDELSDLLNSSERRGNSADWAIDQICLSVVDSRNEILSRSRTLLENLCTDLQEIEGFGANTHSFGLLATDKEDISFTEREFQEDTDMYRFLVCEASKELVEVNRLIESDIAVILEATRSAYQHTIEELQRSTIMQQRNHSENMEKLLKKFETKERNLEREISAEKTAADAMKGAHESEIQRLGVQHKAEKDELFRLNRERKQEIERIFAAERDGFQSKISALTESLGGAKACSVARGEDIKKLADSGAQMTRRLAEFQQELEKKDISMKKLSSAFNGEISEIERKFVEEKDRLKLAYKTRENSVVSDMKKLQTRYNELSESFARLEKIHISRPSRKDDTEVIARLQRELREATTENMKIGEKVRLTESRIELYEKNLMNTFGNRANTGGQMSYESSTMFKDYQNVSRLPPVVRSRSKKSKRS